MNAELVPILDAAKLVGFHHTVLRALRDLGILKCYRGERQTVTYVKMSDLEDLKARMQEGRAKRRGLADA